MLHLVFSLSPDSAVLQRFALGDVVVFLDNAVLRLLRTGQLNATLSELLKQHRLCVLTDELNTRGITVDELTAGIEVIDSGELVDLTVQHALIQSWT